MRTPLAPLDAVSEQCLAQGHTVYDDTSVKDTHVTAVRNINMSWKIPVAGFSDIAALCSHSQCIPHTSVVMLVQTNLLQCSRVQV